MEERCEQLGDSCICSDPLNNNDTIDAITWRPSDSTGTGSKPCGNASGEFTTTDFDAWMTTADTATERGENLPGVSFVLKHLFNIGAPAHTNSSPLIPPLTDRTICIRVYEQFDSTWDASVLEGCPGDCDVKAGRYNIKQRIVESGTATGGTSTTLVDTAKTWSNGQYDNEDEQVVIYAGTGAGQIRSISDTQAPSTLILSSSWTTIPDGTSQYHITDDGNIQCHSQCGPTCVANDWRPTWDGGSPGMGDSRYRTYWYTTGLGMRPSQEFFSGRWMRREMCLDHNTRSGGDAQKVVWRNRVTLLEDLGGGLVEVGYNYTSGATPSDASTPLISRNQFYEPYFDQFRTYAWATPDWGGAACSGHTTPNGAGRYSTHILVTSVTEGQSPCPNPGGCVGAQRESFWPGPASEVEGAAAWQVNSVVATPPSCVEGSCSSNITVQGSASGTATGPITWRGRCKAADPLTNIPACDDLDVCTSLACNYDGEAPGAYTITMESTRDGNVATNAGTFTVDAATWVVSGVAASPTNCDAGSCGTPVDLSGGAAGTAASGTIVWYYRCDAPEPWMIVSACADQAACNAAGVCDYSSAAEGAYAPALRSTRLSGDTFDAASFTVNPSGAATVLIDGAAPMRRP